MRRDGGGNLFLMHKTQTPRRDSPLPRAVKAGPPSPLINLGQDDTGGLLGFPERFLQNNEAVY